MEIFTNHKQTTIKIQVFQLLDIRFFNTPTVYTKSISRLFVHHMHLQRTYSLSLVGQQVGTDILN